MIKSVFILTLFFVCCVGYSQGTLQFNELKFESESDTFSIKVNVIVISEYFGDGDYLFTVKYPVNSGFDNYSVIVKESHELPFGDNSVIVVLKGDNGLTVYLTEDGSIMTVSRGDSTGVTYIKTS